MNILPHKSWHTRNKNNIAKVKKDEQHAHQKRKDAIKRSKISSDAEKYARMGGSLNAFYDNTLPTKSESNTINLNSLKMTVNMDYMNDLKEKQRKFNETYKYTYFDSASKSSSDKNKNPLWYLEKKAHYYKSENTSIDNSTSKINSYKLYFWIF